MIIKSDTNELIECYFRKVEKKEIKKNNYRPKSGWDFDWLKPVSEAHNFEIYGLVVKSSPEIQGLIALKPNYDEAFKCVDVELIESAPHNKKIIKGKLNPNRRYIGVGKCLVAFACQYSIEKGLDGVIELTSKTTKLRFYHDLGGISTFNRQIAFRKKDAIILTKKYLSGGVKWWKEY